MLPEVVELTEETCKTAKLSDVVLPLMGEQVRTYSYWLYKDATKYDEILSVKLQNMLKVFVL